ncbi:sulfurtransferase [Devosia lacusdianchii]|jgi:thiosulfate/3-mercaptopyruvate sulfurtransferase|uniref:sulfurtransferase n=1 Tax=Devosia lacusdianchii TaxID=2917991 RepID=UPI001F06A8CB|nr:sulfurtransferase [Devosia sp. JXJ CY 41]
MRLNLAGAVAVAGLLLTGAAHAERLTDKPLVDAAWLTENLGNESLVVLDIRDVVEGVDAYAAGHVPGAVAARYSEAGWRTTVNNIPGMLPPVEQIEASIAALGVNEDSQVVIVPAGTNASEFGGATRVYWTFKVLGHDAVTILDGGWAGWTKANGEVSTEVAAVTPGDFKAEFRPELLAEVAEVEAAIAGDANLVDARSVAQFIGQEKTNTVQTLGHIPTAVNINFDKFYDAQNASFASPETIAQLAEAAGVGGKSDFIAFCNTGHLASIAWFGLSEVEGLENVRLYDGSMAEWTADPARPVVTN